MKWLVVLMLLTGCGVSDEEKRSLITEKAVAYCICRGGLAKATFFFGALYAQVDCRNGTFGIIKPNDFIGKCK